MHISQLFSYYWKSFLKWTYTQTHAHTFTHTPLTNLAMLNHQTSYLYLQVIADQGGVKDRGTQRGRGGPEGAGAGATHRQHHLTSHALPQRAIEQLKATLLHTVTGLHVKTSSLVWAWQKPHHWSGHDKNLITGLDMTKALIQNLITCLHMTKPHHWSGHDKGMDTKPHHWTVHDKGIDTKPHHLSAQDKSIDTKHNYFHH